MQEYAFQPTIAAHYSNPGIDHVDSAPKSGKLGGIEWDSGGQYGRGKLPGGLIFQENPDFPLENPSKSHRELAQKKKSVGCTLVSVCQPQVKSRPKGGIRII